MRDQLVGQMQRLLAASDARDLRDPQTESHAIERLARREPASTPSSPRAGQAAEPR